MRYITIIIIFIFCFAFKTSYCQENDLSFLIKKIRDNYAGFYDKTNDKKFNNYIRKIIYQSGADTFKALSSITSYFQDQHLQLYALDAVSDLVIDTSQCNNALKELYTYSSNSKEEKDIHEGFWINEQRSNVIYIKKQSTSSYKVYLVESLNSRVPAGFAIGQIHKDGSKYRTDLIAPRSGSRFYLKSEFIGNSLLITGEIAKWKKLKVGYVCPTLKNLPPNNLKPIGKLLDTGTYLLTIPSFGAPNNLIVDSIISIDYKKIASSRNFIIDIRNNTGGTTRSYTSLIPFIYTKPINKISGFTRCTEDLIIHRKETLSTYLKKDIVDSAILKVLKLELVQAETNKGRFYFEEGGLIKFDSIMNMPTNVGIIVNYACQSAAEMMLLDCKQSSKVTIFGEHTMGAIDYLNTYNVLLPSKKYVLIMATVKRKIPHHEMKLDGIGISPDVSISNDNNDWVKFVQDYYNRGALNSSTH